MYCTYISLLSTHFHQFTDVRQEAFRNITAEAINSYCRNDPDECNVLSLTDDGSRKREIQQTFQELFKR